MKKTANMLILIIVFALAATPAWSQQRRPQGNAPEDRPRGGEFAADQGPGDPPSEERREEIRKKIDAIRIWRMTEELKLDSGTSAKLSSLLSPIEQKRRENQREHMETMKNLRQLLRSQKPDEAKIKPLLDKLENNQHSMQELRNAEVKAVKDVLSIEQQARFLVFQIEFEREMREMIAGARGGGQGRPGFGQQRGNTPQRGERPPER